jgi:hypothetical protein
MGRSSSDLVKEVLVENIDSYGSFEELDTVKKRWIRMRQEQIKEGYAKDLAKRQQRKSTFINFVASQIFNMKQKGSDWNGVKDWIRENKELFENRDLLERYNHALNNPQLYFKAYAGWRKDQQAGKMNSFQAPELGESYNE